MLRPTIIGAILASILSGLCSGERTGYGNENLDDGWSYTWYEDEPFMLYCNSSHLNVKSTDYIVWEKASKDGDSTQLERKHDDLHYKTHEFFGVEGFQLQIKKLTSETSGVFVCHVHDSATGTSRAHSIVGINIRERKYDELFDKYRHHFIVAIIATAVFVIPLATICLVYHFRYERREGKKMAYAYNGREHEMKRRPDGLAETVQAEEGKGAYENPEFVQDLSNSSTQL